MTIHPIPPITYQPRTRPGSIGIDLATRESILCHSKSLTRVPLGVVASCPDGAFLFSRSSTAGRLGLWLANSVAVIDPDFCGPEDEIIALVWNFRSEPLLLEVGDYFCQLVSRTAHEVVTIQPFSALPKADSRGGFGSTEYLAD